MSGGPNGSAVSLSYEPRGHPRGSLSSVHCLTIFFESRRIIAINGSHHRTFFRPFHFNHSLTIQRKKQRQIRLAAAAIRAAFIHGLAAKGRRRSRVLQVKEHVAELPAGGGEIPPSAGRPVRLSHRQSAGRVRSDRPSRLWPGCVRPSRAMPAPAPFRAAPSEASGLNARHLERGFRLAFVLQRHVPEAVEPLLGGVALLDGESCESIVDGDLLGRGRSLFRGQTLSACRRA